MEVPLNPEILAPTAHVDVEMVGSLLGQSRSMALNVSSFMLVVTAAHSFLTTHSPKEGTSMCFVMRTSGPVMMKQYDPKKGPLTLTKPPKKPGIPGSSQEDILFPKPFT